MEVDSGVRAASADQTFFDDEYSEDDNDDDKRRAAIRKELGDVPFEELQTMQEKVGSKRYTEAIFGARKDDSTGMEKRHMSNKVEGSKKKKKERPMEVSSKIKVGRFRKVLPTKKKVSRDPRFDDLSGKLNEELFNKSYEFLNEMKQKEKAEVLKQLKKERNQDRKAELKKLLQRMEHQEQAKRKAEHRKQMEKARKKSELEQIKKGKRPYYMKKSDKRKLELADKYKELKSSGKLDKYLAEKRKRNAAKEKKQLPNKRYVI